MFAIVLTHDAQLGLAELVHKKYRLLWPGHPFTFRIPVNGSAPSGALRYLRGQPDCQLVPSARAIRPTIEALADGIADDAWVYWCIDDRYPTSVDAGRAGDVAACLADCPAQVEEVKLMRWRDGVSDRVVDIGGVVFAEQTTETRPWGFWHHHFVRAGLLRRVLARPGLDGASTIRDVLAPSAAGGRRRRRRVDGGYFRGIAVVPHRPLIALGEPLIGGRLTRNGLAELLDAGCETPAYAVVDQEKFYRQTEP